MLAVLAHAFRGALPSAIPVVLGLAPGDAALAHVPGDDAGTAVRNTIDPFGAVALLSIASMYWRGTRALAARSANRGRAPRRNAWLFWAGWMALVIAFGPPLDALAAASFTAHMVQHEIVMLVAAPLLVAAAPSGVLLWGLPRPARRMFASVTAHRAFRCSIAWLATPLVAWLLHLVTLWVWHVPSAFEASLRSVPIHWLQHATFLIAAAFFWHSVMGRRHEGIQRGIAILSVFATAVHTSILGALLTFSTSVWYPSYLSAPGIGGLTPLDDQQVGGLIMWVPGGMVFLAAALAIAAVWLREMEERRAAASRW